MSARHIAAQAPAIGRPAGTSALPVIVAIYPGFARGILAWTVPHIPV
jgi:hypothetical protein